MKKLLSSELSLGILIGLLGGIFTPTEVGAVAVLYSLILGLFVYKELKLRDIYKKTLLLKF